MMLGCQGDFQILIGLTMSMMVFSLNNIHNKAKVTLIKIQSYLFHNTYFLASHFSIYINLSFPFLLSVKWWICFLKYILHCILDDCCIVTATLNIDFPCSIAFNEYSSLYVRFVRLKGNRQSTDCPVEWYQTNQWVFFLRNIAFPDY